MKKKKMNNTKWMLPRSFAPLRMTQMGAMATAFTFALSALPFSSCSNESDPVAEAIELTTPVIQLDGVQASTRAAQSLGDVASGAGINLYLHDSEARECNDNRKGFYDGNFYDGISWTADPSVTVTGGEGHYRAGIVANIELTATNAMPAIMGAIYAYRGSVNVKADGTFTPDGALEPQSSAVLLNLKDADGADIVDYSDYRIKTVGIAMMTGFAAGSDDQAFPNGITDPVPDAITWSPVFLHSSAYGNYTPGTYPATWEEYGALNSSTSAPTTPWPLFEVTYCADGFEWSSETFDDVPNGTATTWTVSYPAAQLTLEAGKLYTFTATLGGSAHITLDAASAVSISDWTTGSEINIGR